MSEALSLRLGEWFNIVPPEKIMLFVSTLPDDMNFMDPAVIPCLKITRWGSKCTAALGTCDVRNDLDVCREGALIERLKHGAISITYIEDTVEKIRADKIVAIPPYLKALRNMTKSELMKDAVEMTQANEIALKDLIESLRSFLFQ